MMEIIEYELYKLLQVIFNRFEKLFYFIFSRHQAKFLQNSKNAKLISNKFYDMHLN